MLVDVVGLGGGGGRDVERPHYSLCLREISDAVTFLLTFSPSTLLYLLRPDTEMRVSQKLHEY